LYFQPAHSPTVAGGCLRFIEMTNMKFPYKSVFLQIRSPLFPFCARSKWLSFSLHHAVAAPHLLHVSVLTSSHMSLIGTKLDFPPTLPFLMSQLLGPFLRPLPPLSSHDFFHPDFSVLFSFSPSEINKLVHLWLSVYGPLFTSLLGGVPGTGCLLLQWFWLLPLDGLPSFLVAKTRLIGFYGFSLFFFFPPFQAKLFTTPPLLSFVLAVPPPLPAPCPPRDLNELLLLRPFSMNRLPPPDDLGMYPVLPFQSLLSTVP